jgi:hypothetical protein
MEDQDSAGTFDPKAPAPAPPPSTVPPAQLISGAKANSVRRVGTSTETLLGIPHRGDDAELQRKAERHAASVEFRMDLVTYYQGVSLDRDTV